MLSRTICTILGAGLLSGCAAGATAGAVGRVTCAVIERAQQACELAGLAPEEPCPLFDGGAE